MSFATVHRLARRDISVLVTGPSGVGKELVARALHEESHRADGPFVAVNCGAVPEALQEAAFFGHAKGAFTGADETRKGRFEEAHGGVLFLDEVGELSASLQAALLRVLQERVVRRVGGHKDIPVDVRVVCATLVNLPDAVAQGRFRRDLYFRLAVFELHVPTLAERAGDIPLLATHFLRMAAAKDGVRAPRLDPATMRILQTHDWPGNVRELRNAMDYAMVMVRGDVVLPEHLPRALQMRASMMAVAEVPEVPEVDAPPELPQLRGMAAVERRTLIEALERSGGNVSEVCRDLAIPRTTLYRKLKKYGLR